jgi:hypothetical protein
MRVAIVVATFLSLAFPGCAPLAITAASVGGASAVSHTMNGITYRTFSAPAANVRRASMTALNHMGIKVTGTSKDDAGAEVVSARANDRDITITLEALSANATRMKVVARNGGGIFFDSATATEIILQTEKSLPRA